MYLSLFILSFFCVFIYCVNFVVGQLFVGSVAVVLGPLFGLLAAMRVAPSLFLVRSGKLFSFLCGKLVMFFNEIGVVVVVEVDFCFWE